MDARTNDPEIERACCAACGGAGGGPFGRANSGWDIETYECPRCFGTGYALTADETERARAMQAAAQVAQVVTAAKPGVAKTQPPPAAAPKRAASDNKG